MNYNSRLLESHLEIVNRILPTATPVGAYCIGMLTSHLLDVDFWPPEEVILAVSKLQSIAAGLELIEEVRSLHEGIKPKNTTV